MWWRLSYTGGTHETHGGIVTYIIGLLAVCQDIVEALEQLFLHLPGAGPKRLLYVAVGMSVVILFGVGI